MSQEFPISQTRAFRTLAALFGGRHGTVMLDDASVRIRFGVMFRAEVPRSAMRGAKLWTGRDGSGAGARTDGTAAGWSTARRAASSRSTSTRPNGAR